MNNETLQTIVGIVIGLGTFFFGGGYLVSKWRGGSKEQEAESKDLISSNDQIKQFFKDQNDDLKLINKTLSEKVEILTREVGEIRGQLNAEIRQKEEYLAILKDKNPETKQFMEYMMIANKEHSETHREMIRVLGEIHAMSKMEHERDFTVKATVTKEPIGSAS